VLERRTRSSEISDRPSIPLDVEDGGEVGTDQFPVRIDLPSDPPLDTDRTLDDRRWKAGRDPTEPTLGPSPKAAAHGGRETVGRPGTESPSGSRSGSHGNQQARWRSPRRHDMTQTLPVD
jgi:hypothetical protein